MMPRVEEFKIFVENLMKTAPIGYKPWFFRCAQGGKNPQVPRSRKNPRGSWINPYAQLTVHQAIRYMEKGFNIGIAGMGQDHLVNIDLDGGNVEKELLKPTLTTRSRSRTGLHGFYFTKDKSQIPNISTDDEGEVRSQGQYVIAAGSYVETDPNKVPSKYRDTAGYYTVEDARPPNWITYEELPQFFRERYEKERDRPRRPVSTFDPKKAGGPHSALFDITAEDVLLREIGSKTPSQRWGAIFHDSTTDANMSISTQGLLHCWRHLVSHNGLTALTVLSGYMTCLEAGTPHKGGQSRIVGDDGAIFHAWLYAKVNGYISMDDPMPVRARHHIARQRLGYTPKKGELLPPDIYNKIIDIVEAEF